MTTAIIQRDVLHQPSPSILVAGTNTVVILPINLLRFDKKTFTIKNLGTNVISTARVQATVIEQVDANGKTLGIPSTNDSDWEDIDNTSLIGLVANGIKSVQIKDDSHKWWRVVCAVNGTTTPAIGHVTAGSV